MAGHTPGPWRIGTSTRNGETYNPSYVCDHSGSSICQVFGISIHKLLSELGKHDVRGLANARLIAAAPELLEALQALYVTQGSMPVASQDEKWLHAMDLALTAIRKAIHD